MIDVTFFIPDWRDEDEQDFIPPDPYEDMPQSERERLDREIDELIEIGAFDPEREIPF